MAASNATLAYFLPRNIAGLSQVSMQRKGSGSVLHFDPDNPQWVEYACFLPRPTGSTVAGYSGTTGVKVNIFWNSADKAVVGAVKWVAQFALIGQTDLPDPGADLWSSTYEDTTTTTVSATAGAANKTVISCTIAHIQGAQTTAPAVGDFVRLRIRRESASTADTMLGDALLWAVELQDY